MNLNPGGFEDQEGVHPVDVRQVVTMSQRVSYATYAPPDYALGTAPLTAALPPAPQDEQVRARGLLHCCITTCTTGCSAVGPAGTGLGAAQQAGT